MVEITLKTFHRVGRLKERKGKAHCDVASAYDTAWLNGLWLN